MFYKLTILVIVFFSKLSWVAILWQKIKWCNFMFFGFLLWGHLWGNINFFCIYLLPLLIDNMLVVNADISNDIYPFFYFLAFYLRSYSHFSFNLLVGDSSLVSFKYLFGWPCNFSWYFLFLSFITLIIIVFILTLHQFKQKKERA